MRLSMSIEAAASTGLRGTMSTSAIASAPDTRAPVDQPPGEWRPPPSGWRPPAERSELLGDHWLVNRPGAGGADDDGSRWR